MNRDRRHDAAVAVLIGLGLIVWLLLIVPALDQLLKWWLP